AFAHANCQTARCEFRQPVGDIPGIYLGISPKFSGINLGVIHKILGLAWGYPRTNHKMLGSPRNTPGGAGATRARFEYMVIGTTIRALQGNIKNVAADQRSGSRSAAFGRMWAGW